MRIHVASAGISSLSLSLSLKNRARLTSLENNDASATKLLVFLLRPKSYYKLSLRVTFSNTFDNL